MNFVRNQKFPHLSILHYAAIYPDSRQYNRPMTLEKQVTLLLGISVIGRAILHKKSGYASRRLRSGFVNREAVMETI